MDQIHAAVFLSLRRVRAFGPFVLAVCLAALVHAEGRQAPDLNAASWSEYRTRMNRHPADEEQIRDELVLLRVLSGEFRDPAFEPTAEVEERLALIRLEVATRALQRAVRGSVTVTEEAVAGVFEAEKASLAKPKRWQLADIMLRAPASASDQARGSIRERMDAIRREIVEGVPFDEAARRVSESSSSVRGGNLGVVALDELSPEVAAVVAGLGDGDLSPVVEVDAGFVLLRCSKVFEAETPDLGEVREEIESRLRGEAAASAWQELTRKLLDGADLRVDPHRPEGRATGSNAVATYRVGEERRSLTADRLEVFLRARREGRPLSAIPRDELVESVPARVLLDLCGHEAVVRRLVDVELEETIRWKELELEARIALDVRVDELVSVPTEEEIREVYATRREQLVEPEMRHLRMIRIAIDHERPRSFYESVQRVGTRAASGEVSLEEAADELGSEIVDLGWLAPNDVWRLGRAVDQAVAGLEVGGVTPVVQEGKGLFIVGLAGRRDRRILSFEESREMLLTDMLRRRRLQAEEAIRQQILADNRQEAP